MNNIHEIIKILIKDQIAKCDSSSNMNGECIPRSRSTDVEGASTKLDTMGPRDQERGQRIHCTKIKAVQNWMFICYYSIVFNVLSWDLTPLFADKFLCVWLKCLRSSDFDQRWQVLINQLALRLFVDFVKENNCSHSRRSHGVELMNPIAFLIVPYTGFLLLWQHQRWMVLIFKRWEITKSSLKLF